MHSVIGIDIGTGSTKAVLVNEHGAVLAQAQQFYPVAHTPPGYSEQDPDAVCASFFACLNEVLQTAEVHPVRVCISSAMHSVICVDEKGAALTGAILWSDTRSADVAESLKHSAQGAQFYGATGTPIHAMSPLCKIRWIAENQPDLFARTAKFISIKEYIWWKLFGVYEIDHSLASATGLFHIQELHWYAPALAWAGILPTQLSAPVRVLHARTWSSNSHHLDIERYPDISFVIGASDGCLANLASFATGAGVAALTIGTSGAVRVGSEVPVLHFPSMPFCYLLEAGHYICGGAINNGGSVLHWVQQTFGTGNGSEAVDYNQLFTEMEAADAGSDGLLFLPYLAGERAPVWDAKSCGVYFGIRGGHGRVHLMRAAIEGVCFALHDVIMLLESCSAAITSLRVSGGFTASPFWLQMMADVTGKRVECLQTGDASALGAALLALRLDGVTVAAPVAEATFYPREREKAIYSRSYQVYRTLYPSLQRSMHEHHKLNT